MRRFLALLAVILIVAAVWRKPAVAPRGPTVAAPPAVPVSIRAHSTVGFRTRAQLEEHFEKHGREFGQITIDEYLVRAQRLRDAATGNDVLEVVRSTDGVVSRFDRVTGAFLAANADGTIRTYFRPNDGEAYFRRQAKRRPAP